MNTATPVTVTALSHASYAHASYDSLCHTSRTYGELITDDKSTLKYTLTFDTHIQQDTGLEVYSIWKPIGDKGLYKRIKNVYPKAWRLSPAERELASVDSRMQIAHEQRAALLRTLESLDAI